ncbi:MAG: hypothetical protein FD187_3161 [bacterium]|nr:MAG: hypothetical protein FD187_3161 [bacterium]
MSRHRSVGIAVGLLRERGIRSIEAQDARRGRRQTFAQAFLGNQDARPAIFEHEGQTVGRIVRVEGNVGPPRLEGRQQRDDQRAGTFQRDGDPRVGFDAPRGQKMCEPVGATVQFAVAQAVPCKHHRLRLWGAFDLLFEELVYRDVRDRGARGVPLDQQTLRLGGRQDVQRVQRRLRGVFQRCDQLLQGAFHEGANPLRVDRYVGLRAQAEAFVQVVYRQDEGVVGALFAVQHFDAFQGRAGAVLPGAVAVVEQGREQRRRGGQRATALCQAERGVFVARQGQQALLRVVQGFAHRARVAADA